MKTRVWIFLSLAWVLTACSNQTKKIENLCPLQIFNPSRSDQKSAKFVCPNGLKLLIISSPTAPTSGAALVVRTGSNADPEVFPGMAHFTEHCVFLGNHKYPQASEFEHFLSAHNGIYNAFTTSNTTSYLFSVESSALKPALKQFVHLFIQPLFRQDDLDREKNAVNQEFAIQLTNDFRRMARIEQIIAPEGYPTKRFSCGNTQTLSELTSQDMHDWFDQHYSPENMTVVVYTSEPLEQAERFIPKLFAKIPTSKKYRPLPPFIDTKDTQTLNKVFITKPVQRSPLLEIYWHIYDDASAPIPDSCFTTLGHILEYEHDRGLVSLLKEQGWITSLQTSHYKTSKNTQDFCIIYELTALGDKEYEQVIRYTFAYLKYIQEHGIPTHCVEEISKINSWNYMYSPQIELFDALHSSIYLLAQEDFATYPYRSIVLPSFSQDEEQALFSVLSPEQARLVLSSLKDDRIAQTQEHYDPIFDMFFYEKPYYENMNAHASLSFALPGVNTYIPDPSHRAIPLATKLAHESFPFVPESIYQSPNMSLYSCEDHYYTTPQLSAKFRFQTPLVSLDHPSSLVCSDLYCTMLNDQLYRAFYPAAFAGFSFAFQQKGDGLDLNLSGHTDTFAQVLNNILTYVSKATSTQEQFEYYKQQLKTKYERRLKQCPIKYGLDYLKACVLERTTPVYKKLETLSQVSYSDFESFCTHCYDSVAIEGLLLGSLTSSDQNNIIQELRTFTDHSKAYSPPPYFSKRLLSCTLPISIQYDLPGNGAIIFLQNYTQVTPEAFAATQMFVQWFSQIVFTELRTKQQLGYVVGMNYQNIAHTPCCMVYLRSDAYSPQELTNRGLEFLHDAADRLEDFGLSEAIFNDLKHAYIQQIKNPTTTFENMPSNLFPLIFEPSEKGVVTPDDRLKAAQNMSYEQFKTYNEQFLREQFGPNILVHVEGSPA